MQEVASAVPAGSVLSFDTGLLINIAIQWFNVLLLTGVLVFLLYKPVKKFMQDRTSRIRSDIESAREGRKDADALRSQYEQKLAEIGGEREEILQQAHRKAMEKGEQLIKEAREKSEILIAQAREQAELERINGKRRIKEQVVELAALIAGRYIRGTMDEGLRDRLVEEAFAGWEDAS